MKKHNISEIERIRHKYNYDADEPTGWITINGARVPLDEEGNAYGPVIDKINSYNSANVVKEKWGISISNESIKNVTDRQSLNSALETIDKVLSKAGFTEGTEVITGIQIRNSEGSAGSVKTDGEGGIVIDNALINNGYDNSEQIEHVIKEAGGVTRGAGVNTLIGEAVGRSALDYISAESGESIKDIAHKVVEEGFARSVNGQNVPVSTAHDALMTISSRAAKTGPYHDNYTNAVIDAFADVAANGDGAKKLSQYIVSDGMSKVLKDYDLTW